MLIRFCKHLYIIHLLVCCTVYQVFKQLYKKLHLYHTDWFWLLHVLNLINVCIQNCTACKLINLCSVNYNIEWIVLQLEAIRAKQVHKAPPTFPHQQHHFQVLVTWLSIIYGFFFIVKDLRKILQVDIPNWHPLINYLKTHINECKSKCNFLLPYWIFIIILQRVI